MFKQGTQKAAVNIEMKDFKEELDLDTTTYTFYLNKGELGMKHICFTKKDVADSFLAKIKEKFAGVEKLAGSGWEKARVTNDNPRYKDKNYFLIRLTRDQLNYLRNLPKEKTSSEDVSNHIMNL